MSESEGSAYFLMQFQEYVLTSDIHIICLIELYKHIILPSSLCFCTKYLKIQCKNSAALHIYAKNSAQVCYMFSDSIVLILDVQCMEQCLLFDLFKAFD